MPQPSRIHSITGFFVLIFNSCSLCFANALVIVITSIVIQNGGHSKHKKGVDKKVNTFFILTLHPIFISTNQTAARYEKKFSINFVLVLDIARYW